MGEKAEGQAGGWQMDDSGRIPQQAGSVAGIGVAHGAKVLIEAAEKSRTTAHASVKLQDGAIQFLAEFDHGVCLIDVGHSEELRRERSESVLGGDEDPSRILTAPGNIEEPEQHARRTDAQKLIKISRHALPVVDGSNLGMTESGDVSMERIDR